MKFAVRVCQDGMRRNTIASEPTEDRFWKLVDKRGPDECWLWKNSTTGRYPVLFHQKQPVKAHRFSYELHSGLKIPEGMCVCHKCDNTRCVNPGHFFIGTHQDNMADCKKKGRFRSAGLFGEASGHAVYKTEQVLEVKRLLLETTLSQKQIAKMTGLEAASVSMISQGRNWRKITGFSRQVCESGSPYQKSQKRRAELKQLAQNQPTTAPPLSKPKSKLPNNGRI